MSETKILSTNAAGFVPISTLDPISSLTEPSKPNNINMEQIQTLQPTINIGMIGHVAHGKSTLVRQITGVKTGVHSKEQERNMTIKLGYANAKIYRCDGCPRPACYKAFSSAQQGQPKCSSCKGKMNLVRHLSFIDCPGHEVLMATMLNAAAAMDAAVLVIAANEECPRPQTAEHLAAAELIGLKHIIPVQNKLDLVQKSQAKLHADSMREFIKGTAAAKSPLIPVAAQYGVNVDVLCQYLVEQIPAPKHDLDSPCRLQAIRSFDVNKPGTPFEELKGAVFGGTLSRGVVRVGQQVEIRPGIVRTDAKGNHHCFPLFSKVVSISSEKNQLQEAIPGGLIGVGTNIDPSLSKDDGLVGQTLGPIGTLSDVYQDIQIEYRLLKRLVGTQEGEKVLPLKKKEELLLHVGSNTTLGVVRSIGKNPNSKRRVANIRLTRMPICAQPGDRLAFSRSIESNHWRLIGMGEITANSVPLQLYNTYAMKN